MCLAYVFGTCQLFEPWEGYLSSICGRKLSSFYSFEATDLLSDFDLEKERMSEQFFPAGVRSSVLAPSVCHK